MTLAEDAIIAHYKDHGFRRVVVRRDEPNFSYPIHYHAYNLAFQVMEGEMTVTINHHPTKLGPGDHAMVPANALHTTTIGSAGCVYIHAEKTSPVK